MKIKDMIEEKFLVIKLDDIDKCLTTHQQESLGDLLRHIDENRKRDGKKDNDYLVVNVDEPYAELVFNIMRKYGHCRPPYSWEEAEDFLCGCRYYVSCIDCPSSIPKESRPRGSWV